MLITLALPINTEVAAHDSQIKKLVKQMKNSEYSIIANNDVSDSKAKTIQLTNDSMARFFSLHKFLLNVPFTLSFQKRPDCQSQALLTSIPIAEALSRYARDLISFPAT